MRDKDVIRKQVSGKKRAIAEIGIPSSSDKPRRDGKDDEINRFILQWIGENQGKHSIDEILAAAESGLMISIDRDHIAVLLLEMWARKRIDRVMEKDPETDTYAFFYFAKTYRYNFV